MNSITNWIERNLVPFVSRITNLKYFQAIRNGFLAIMPLTIIGSIFMLVTDFPVVGYPQFMASIFGTNWSDYISPAYRATFNIMGLVFSGTMAYKLSEAYGMKDKLTALIFGIVGYIVVIPKTVELKSGEVAAKVMSFTWTGTQGVLTAIVIAAIAVEVLRFCECRNIKITMLNSVPEAVSNAFSALIPGIIFVTIGLLLNGLGSTFSKSFPQLLYALLQLPLQGIVGTSFMIIIVAFLNGFLWWFGVHPTVINSLLYPILYANAEANQTMAELGTLTTLTGHYGTVQMLDQIATMGGAGCTIGLAIAMVLIAKTSRMKSMSKLAIIPSIFNINEPLIFGLPVVFNPLLLIPVSLAPVVAVGITILSIRIGFMPMFTGIQAPWATPPVISGFLIAGWQGAITQLIAIIAVVVIFYPFVKALDKQYGSEEANDN